MQQSELALFAREFRRVLDPLRAALGDARDRLRAARGALPFAADELATSLAGLVGELEGLLARVALERAAIHVFGPAKAGKSTLLEALAGVHLSEASSLPSYPCVLCLRSAEREEAALLGFDGSSTTLSDPAAPRLALQRLHGELSARVRETRAAGEAFDAARHLPSALRRVERALPATPLAEGALELVECPPIHAALFPSYAEMLMGAPDQARAGVFVVRAAQLADDTVFDGVEELLERFERLILVLNLDQHGRELVHDGEPVASAECQDPARLIAAFEELTTCEPLARALRSERVPVLALDLFAAARARLHGAEEEPALGRRARFADLARELSGVLDGHEALRALTQSALKRAGELGAEARELASTPGLDELTRRLSAAEQERAALVNVLGALERLGQRSRARWEGEELFEGLRSRLVSRCVAHAGVLARENHAPIARALEDWFANGSSLQELLGTGLEPRLVSARAELARWAERALREELKLAGEGAGLSAGAGAEFSAGRLSLAALLGSCAELLRVTLEPRRAVGALRVLDVEAIPVKKRLGQRLTWRSAAEVRRALFGAPEAPSAALASRAKARLLGDEARQAMQRSAAERALAILEDEARRSARTLDEALSSVFVGELHRHIERERARSSAPLSELEARVAEFGALTEGLGGLVSACVRAQAGLADLAERFAPAGVLVPAPRPYGVRATSQRSGRSARAERRAEAPDR